MFRLHKPRPTKSGERIDFKFSHFKALQVPKGWDKLFVSVISVETGKTIAKSGKALVRNGTCQWTETVSESIWVSQEDSSKELEDCLFKLVVAMGSARSGILGETTVNMTSYISSSAVVPVSLPLNKCNYGTIIQVKIHCLTPRRKLRENESKEKNSDEGDLNAESCDMDIKSDGSDGILPRSNGSSSSKEMDSALQKEEPESTGTSFAVSDSHQGYDSVEDENFSSRKNFNDNDGQNLNGAPDSTSSQNNATEGSYHVGKPSESNHSSSISEDAGSGNYSKNNEQELALSSFGISASSKSLLEAAEDTIQELRAESKMWERHAQKLMLDLEILRKEFSDQSKNQANLQMELSAACTERDGFRNKVEQLKVSLEKMEKAAALENSTFQDEGVTHIKKELVDEIKFQKESNANLALQLKRSQESNIELVTVLQELEETIEKQKLEIENLSSLQSKSSHMEKSIDVNIEENKNTMLQFQQLQESERNLQANVQLLEQALEEKDQVTGNQESLSNRTILHIETEYKAKLSSKDYEIASLKAKLSEFHKEKHSAKMVSINGGEADPSREIEVLKTKLQELERDCNELTDENLELLFKLKEIKNYSSEHLEDYSSNLGSKVSHHESEVNILEENLKKKVLREIKDHYDVSMQQLEILKNELEVKVTGLDEELSQKRSEIERLEDNLLSKEEEIKDFLFHQNELEAKVSGLQKEKVQLEENMEIVLRDSAIATKCLNDLRRDIQVLSRSVDSHVSANKTLENKCSEIESENCELELQLTGVQHENVQLSACISDLEAQLRLLTDERESKQLDLEHSNSLVMKLQDEVTGLRNDMEFQEIDMKRKLEDMQNQWSEAQEECEYLGRENLKLQATAKRFIRECSSVQRLNGDLMKQKSELQKHCTNLEAKLRESIENFAKCSRKVEGLEENLSSMLEDIALKEKALTSQLDALLDENGEQREKLVLAENSLTKMHLEKMVEIENLQQEIRKLTRQLSATHDEKERIASEAEHEVSGLYADKAELQCALQELQSKIKWAENELNNIQMESDAKVRDLMDQLAASKQNQELLMANHEKLLKQLGTLKSSEEKFKINSNDLELKLTVSEYERQQLMKESTNMKVKLLRIEPLEQEILSLKNELNATKSEKEKLKTSLHLISEECEDLKIQKCSLLENISALQKDVSEFEYCKRNTISLEEKLLQLEGDLMEKEELRLQDSELKNELSMIKKANRQLQWKIQILEEEKDKFLMRAQALEEELKLIKEEKQNQRESSGINSYRSKHQREGDNGHKIHEKSSPATRVDLVSKIQSLEAELAKTKEANSTYKSQIKRLSSEGKNNRSNARKPSAEGEVVTKERFERTKSSLESELRDIRERYLQMSLKYAEVEAQREELVMKLKVAKNGKRWFS